MILVLEILIGRENDTPTCYILETLSSRFGHFSVNDKLRFAVNGFMLPVCPYLELKFRGWLLAADMFVFIHPLTSVLAEKLSSKLRFF